MPAALQVSPALAIAQYLVDEGVALAPPEDTNPNAPPPSPGPWTVYTSVLPDKPNDVISVRDTSPQQDGRAGGVRYTHPAVQVRIRGTDYPSAYRKGLDIEAALDAIDWTMVATDMGIVCIQCFTVKAGLTPLGTEELLDRDNLTINGILTLRPV